MKKLDNGSCTNHISRVSREEALDYRLPNDLDAVFRQAKPYAWSGTMTWGQSKRFRDDAQNSVEMADHVFGRGYVQEVLDQRLLTVISITVRLLGDETGDGFAMFVPKMPDPMWCWNQTTKNIHEFQHMTKLDLF